MAAATERDINRLHTRVDDACKKVDGVKDDVADLAVEVRANIALCKDCRPKVMGNGDSLGTRLTVLETERTSVRRSIKWIVLMASAVGSLVGGGITLVAFFGKG